VCEPRFLFVPVWVPRVWVPRVFVLPGVWVCRRVVVVVFVGGLVSFSVLGLWVRCSRLSRGGVRGV
jgi:hypothetical protein